MKIFPPIRLDPNCRAIKWTLLLGICLIPQLAWAQGTAMPVHEFVKKASQRVGLDFRVEGRWAIATKTKLKFRNCTIEFRSTEQFPEFDRRKQNLEVSGKLIKEGGKLIFEVSSFRATENDADQYYSRVQKLRTRDPKTLFAIADWVEARGEFYNDQLLKDLATKARANGFDWETTGLGPEDYEERLRLAERAEKVLKLPDSKWWPLAHDAFVIRRKQAENDPNSNWDALAISIQEKLPGATEPLVVIDQKLQETYLLTPYKTYLDLPDQRKLFHRILRNDIVWRGIQAKIQPDFRNGNEIAELIEESLPEMRERAEEYRKKALQTRVREVESLDRKGLVELRKQLIDRGEKPQADEVLESWLTMKFQELPQDDADGLLALANDAEDLSGSRSAGVKYLVEAERRVPQHPEAVQRLEKLGYIYFRGRWMSNADRKLIPETAIEKALREGRIERGMSVEEVRKSQGAPSSITRIARPNGYSELWVYVAPGAQKIVVQFEQSAKEGVLKVKTVQIRTGE